MEKLIKLNKENIEQEHICCSLADKKGRQGVATKKEWLKQCFDDGLVFLKVDVRGKAFIEYVPAERAWSPIDAADYMYINCFWVSGRFKGKGYGKALLAQCEADARAQGKKGLVAISSNKKRPFLSDKQFFVKHGFQVCDEAPPYFQLLYLEFKEGGIKPKFKERARAASIANQQGLAIYYTHQCPYSADYVADAIRAAESRGVKAYSHQYRSYEEAQNAPCGVTTYSLFYNGRYITNEILTVDKIMDLIDSHEGKTQGDSNGS